MVIIAAGRSHGPKPYGAGSQRANRSPQATPAAEGFLSASGSGRGTPHHGWHMGASVIEHFHSAKLLGVTATPIQR
jgi:hypothetical protein